MAQAFAVARGGGLGVHEAVELDAEHEPACVFRIAHADVEPARPAADEGNAVETELLQFAHDILVQACDRRRRRVRFIHESADAALGEIEIALQVGEPLGL